MDACHDQQHAAQQGQPADPAGAAPAPQMQHPLHADDTAVRTAVALAIVKSRRQAQARSAREEALDKRLKRLKAGMATLVKVLRKKAACDGTAVSVLEHLLAALEADSDPARYSVEAHVPESQPIQRENKRLRTSQPVAVVFSSQTIGALQQPPSQLASSRGSSHDRSASNSQLSRSLAGGTNCFDDAVPHQNLGQPSQQQTQGRSIALGHGCGIQHPFHVSQVSGEPQSVTEGILQAAREADVCGSFSLQETDAAVLQERTASLTRLLEAAHAVQLAAAALTPRAASSQTAEHAPLLDAFCAQTPHQTILAFVRDTLVCLPPSALRQTYMSKTAQLLASCLLSCPAGSGEQAVVLASDLTLLLRQLLEVHAGQHELKPGRQISPAPQPLQIRQDGASAFLVATLKEPQLGQLLLLCCSQCLEATFNFFASLPSKLQTLKGNPPAAAGMLTQALSQHSGAKQVLQLLDACIQQLPAWLACCGAAGPTVQSAANSTAATPGARPAAAAAAAAAEAAAGRPQGHERAKPHGLPQNHKRPGPQLGLQCPRTAHKQPQPKSQLQQQQHSQQLQQDASDDSDALMSILALAVQHLVSAYSRVHAARCSAPLATTALTHLLATLAASLQQAARTTPLTHIASVPILSLGEAALAARRSACLRLCTELRNAFKPSF